MCQYLPVYPLQTMLAIPLLEAPELVNVAMYFRSEDTLVTHG